MTGHPTNGAPDTLRLKLWDFGLWRVKVLGILRSRQAAAAARTEWGKAGLNPSRWFYSDGTRTLRNTVGKHLSQWFIDEPHIPTAALAGVVPGRIYPSGLIGIKAGKERARGAQHAKSRGEGDKGFAPGWCSVEGRGDRGQEWVCLMPV